MRSDIEHDRRLATAHPLLREGIALSAMGRWQGFVRFSDRLAQPPVGGSQ
jgi:hypothetical protein